MFVNTAWQVTVTVLISDYLLQNEDRMRTFVEVCEGFLLSLFLSKL